MNLDFSEGIKGKLNDCSHEIENYILSNVTSSNKELLEASTHYIKAGGKRLRPFIVMKCYELIGSRTDLIGIIPVAAAFEVLHTFTLIHDDIIDNDDLRRGVVAVHEKWGMPIAILAGDLLFGITNVLVNHASLPAHVKSSITAELGSLCIELCEGQTMDIDFEKRKNVSTNEYLRMIHLKTASFFNKCAAAGGMVAETTYKTLASLRDYGECLGMAFQIIDDVLDVISSTENMGKPSLSDLKKGKKTIVVLDALEHLSGSSQKKLNELLSLENRSEKDITAVLELISESGAIERAQKTSLDYVNGAIDALKCFHDCEAKEDLIAIARIAIYRVH